MEKLERCGEELDGMFSRFGTVPACDRQTDERTDGRLNTA